MKAHSLILGVVGDDFTGSSDAASFIVKSGLKTMLFDGIPQQLDLDKLGVQAAVIALKSRMADPEEAKAQSLKAAQWLKDQGAAYIFSKYCSTFDSTHKGNIGPILDNFLNHFKAKRSIICPALPVNGRIVKDGVLYINGLPLSESPMKNHPLTPMWDSRLKVLMEAQSQYPCFDLPHDVMYDESKLQAFLSKLDAAHDHYYVVPDYENDEDAARIVQIFGRDPVQSGGSGILTAIGKACLKAQSLSAAALPEAKTQGQAFLIAGSCSAATRRQIEVFKQSGFNTLKIDAHALMKGRIEVQALWQEYLELNTLKPCLIYSSGNPEEVKALQQCYGVAPLAAAIEGLMTKLAKFALDAGFTRFIVAGGETSGAVMRALPADGYLIGASVAPGVPVMIPARRPQLRLVLKSGNFGDEHFFAKALAFTDANQ